MNKKKNEKNLKKIKHLSQVVSFFQFTIQTHLT